MLLVSAIGDVSCIVAAVRPRSAMHPRCRSWMPLCLSSVLLRVLVSACICDLDCDGPWSPVPGRAMSDRDAHVPERPSVSALVARPCALARNGIPCPLAVPLPRAQIASREPAGPTDGAVDPPPLTAGWRLDVEPMRSICAAEPAPRTRSHSGLALQVAPAISLIFRALVLVFPLPLDRSLATSSCSAVASFTLNRCCAWSAAARSIEPGSAAARPQHESLLPACGLSDERRRR